MNASLPIDLRWWLDFISNFSSFSQLRKAASSIDVTDCGSVTFSIEVPLKAKKLRRPQLPLFYELLPDSAKEVASKNLLSSTLKVGIAVEVAVGMSHFHSRCMMECQTAASYISDYCISLIKRCMSFKAAERPTFDEIIDDMFDSSFQLESEDDVKAIKHPFRELNRI